MEIKRKVKKLTTLALALVLTLALLPTVSVFAEENAISPMPEEYVNLFIERITNQVKHIRIMKDVDWLDTPMLTHVVFVREGAMLEYSGIQFSGIYINHGFRDLQFYDSFFSGDYSQSSFSFDVDSSPDFHIAGYEHGTLNNFVEVPLSLNHFIDIDIDEIGTWGDGWNPIVSWEDGYIASIMILVIDEATATLITGGGTPSIPGDITNITTVPNLNTASNWAQESITEAVGLGLVPQNLQAQYTQATTRAEFAALAVALYETITGRVITERATFNDSTDINVQKMGGLGVVQGVGGGNFNPNGTITREQAAVMLARLAYAIGQPLPASAPTFADNAQLSSWAVDGVGQMQAAGIMGGVGNNNFAPQGQYTREQSIVTMMRLFDILD